MQIFTCPFCGPRSETEFHFVGDFPKPRPDGMAKVSAEMWSDYLHNQNNPKGAASELWMHMACHEIFRMDRHTVTHEVTGSYALSSEAQS
ncbi:sarcosine oxidase subunit delta [Nitratireductor aestuarii]|uniref:Sarcosine oxidase subunit delta n=1 Tax=Nitratireductor aestuarii TaxID=1735103 RepID=A0A916WAU1_9HYPH|nr:sarcosine oxidase subunit delta [Nitratireductor aestuarii]GGA81058.1 sarcosine oxidase subunit delta [Nitratireductor aestuarii]